MCHCSLPKFALALISWREKTGVLTYLIPHSHLHSVHLSQKCFLQLCMCMHRGIDTACFLSSGRSPPRYPKVNSFTLSLCLNSPSQWCQLQIQAAMLPTLTTELSPTISIFFGPYNLASSNILCTWFLLVFVLLCSNRNRAL